MAASESGRLSGLHQKRRSLSGAFDVTESIRAFELLLEHSLYGSVIITDGLIDTCLFFTRGGLRVLCSGRKLPSLRSRLVPTGFMSPDEARQTSQILKQQEGERGKPRDERDILINDQRVSPEDVDRAAREIIEEVILDCLFWQDPQYEVVTGEPNLEQMQRRDLSAVTLSLGVKDLVQNVVTRIRGAHELLRTVASLQVKVEPTPKGKEAVEGRSSLGEGPTGRRRERFLGAVVREPGMTAVELGKRLKVGELEVASRLHDLSKEGYLRIERTPISKKEEMERLRKMEEAIDQAISQLLRRMRVAKDAIQQGDGKRAARHMARAGGLLMGEGRSDEAVRTFNQALKQSPDDLEAREGYVQGLWATKRQSEAAKESKELGERYLALNLPGRARRVLERALGFEEEATTLDLLVKSFVKLRKPKAAAEAGERLINRLRREGKSDEAREMAAQLLEIGDESDRKRLRRAAGGIDPRKVGGLLALGALIGLLYIPVAAQAETRSRYEATMSDVAVTLAKRTPVEDLEKTISTVVAKVDQISDGNHPVANRAAEVGAHLRKIQDDLHNAGAILDQLPWRERATNVENLLAQVEKFKADSPALAIPFKRLKTELREYRDRFDADQVELQNLGATPQGLTKAKEMRVEYKRLPTGLRNTHLPVRIETEPPGASVRYNGRDVEGVTPLQVRLPLKGTRGVVIWRKGYQSLRGESIEFDDLVEDDSPVFSFKLTPEQSEVAVRPKKPKKPKVRRRPRRKRPRTKIGVTTKTPKKPKKTYVTQIQLKDGYTLQKPPGMKLSFVQEPMYFSSLKAPNRFRAEIHGINRIRGRKVYLVALRVKLFVRRSSGWVAEKTQWVELDDELERLVHLHPGRNFKVQPFSRIFRADHAELREAASDGLNKAIRIVLNRERSRR